MTCSLALGSSSKRLRFFLGTLFVAIRVNLFSLHCPADYLARPFAFFFDDHRLHILT